MLDKKVFDSDNHFYELNDAFTRYVPTNMQSRCVQWNKIDGKSALFIGGKLNTYIKDPSFEYVPRPGALYKYTYGDNPDGYSARDIIKSSMIHKDKIKDAYYLQDKKNKMKELEIDKVIIYPTYGLILENFLYQDPEALYTTISGFNRWILDEWGSDDSVIPAYQISLVDERLAILELENLIQYGAKVINITPSYIPKNNFGISPTNKIYNDFWNIINKNKIVIALHENDSWNIRFSKYWSSDINKSFNLDSNKFSTLVSNNNFHDFFAKLFIDHFFYKYKNIKFITSESGCSWVYSLFDKLHLANKQNTGIFGGDFIEIFKSHIYVSPFAHEDIYKLKNTIDSNNIILSTDYPHVEGSCYPDKFLNSIDKMSKYEINNISYNNLYDLIYL